MMSKETSPQPRIKPVRIKPSKADPDMPELQAAPQTETDSAADRRLLVFRKIAAPLMAVVPSASGGNNGTADPTQSAQQFAALLDTTVSLNRRISEMLDLEKADSTVRWQAASAATEIVAAHFRATGHALTSEEAVSIVATLAESMTPGLMNSVATPSSETFETASTLSRSLKAFAPVASAITRFSFGRDPMELLGEVVRRLAEIAATSAGRLEGKTEPSIDTDLYFAVLEVVGEFYMESHFNEMTRLLEMAPDERKEYVQQHNRKIPMEPVWEPLGLKLGMLEALTAYLPAAPIGGA